MANISTLDKIFVMAGIAIFIVLYVLGFSIVIIFFVEMIYAAIVFLVTMSIKKPGSDIFSKEILGSGFKQVFEEGNLYRRYSKNMDEREILLEYAPDLVLGGAFDLMMSLENPGQQRFELQRLNAQIGEVLPSDDEVRSRIGEEAQKMIAKMPVRFIKAGERIEIVATIRNPSEMVDLPMKLERALILVREHLNR